MKREYLIVHHTGAEEKNTEQIRRYHLSLGWQDIGYNFVIEKSGKVVPGRSLTLPGAHCRASGMNRKVQLLATWRTTRPGPRKRQF